MSWQPIEEKKDTRLRDLVMGGVSGGGGLENLARLFLMSGMGQQQQGQQPRTVNVGGMNILDVTPRSKLEGVFPALQGLATGYLGMQGVNRQQKFLKQIEQVARSGKRPEEIMADLMPLITQNPQIAKELGLMDVVEQYQKMTGKEWKPTTKEEAEEFERLKAGIKGNIADPVGLTSEQQIQARALARKIYGVRGAQFGLPAVYEEMRKGKSIDEVEDSLRYAGQSKEFSGDIRNATQSILMNTSEDKSQKAMDYIDDLLSKGDMEGTKNQLKRLARTQAGMEEQRAIIGKERTIKLLDEIQDDLNNLERMGVNTNIFTGTAEQIASKVGTVKSPEARKIATKIAAAVQNYRRSMTGVQFGMPENLEYKIMFPTIGRTANFNSANINALREVMSGDLDNFYSLSMGENEYRNIFGQSTPGAKIGNTQISQPTGVPQVGQVFNGQRIKNIRRVK